MGGALSSLYWYSYLAAVTGNEQNNRSPPKVYDVMHRRLVHVVSDPLTY